MALLPYLPLRALRRLCLPLVLLALSSAPALAAWTRVPGGLRLEGAVTAEDRGSFLTAFWEAALQEPRFAPIAIWLAVDGGDEAAAFEIAILVQGAKDQGLRIATIVEGGAPLQRRLQHPVFAG